MIPHTFTLVVHIHRPPPLVYAHLTHPPNFIGLQPLLTAMSPVQPVRVAETPGVAYETVETFRLGPLPLLRNRIRVRTLFTQPNHRLDTLVHSWPGIRLEVVYTLTPVDADHTTLTEDVDVHVAPWLAGYVVDTAKRVQRQTLDNLKRRLEAA